MKKFISVIFIAIILAIGVFVLRGTTPKNNIADIGNTSNNGIAITVIKSPTCSCCAGYIQYLKQQGFNVKVEDVQDTLAVKEKYHIPTELESCHTSIVGNYFIEGHVPVQAIQKLLSEKPDILGIALPGMPSGSPGMGGAKAGEFKIESLSKDGSIKDYLNL